MKEEHGLSKEEKDIKRMEIVQALSELGENDTANQLFKKIAKKITFAEREDWVNEQVCSTFPNDIDIRCIAFCCSPHSPCPYRAAVLKKLGWSMNDYIRMKKAAARIFTLEVAVEEK
jgi:DNA modification methylase